MSKKSIVVSNVLESHDNPIAELVQVACKFDSDITLESDNRKINAKSIMGIMAFNPTDGMAIDIVANGNDEQEAVVLARHDVRDLFVALHLDLLDTIIYRKLLHELLRRRQLTDEFHLHFHSMLPLS